MKAYGLGVGAIALTIVAGSTSVARQPAALHWSESFGSSPAAYVMGPQMKTWMKGRSLDQVVVGTIRFTVELIAGGNSLRVRLSNEAGSQPLRVQAASVAKAIGSGNGSVGDILPLTFNGAKSISIPAGAPVVSDPVPLSTIATDRLVVSAYVPDGISFNALGGAAMTTGPGDQTLSASTADPHPVVGRPFVTGVSVATAQETPVIVAFGDSLTDGTRANPTDLRGYPAALAYRINALQPARRRAVINAGIGGNRLLSSSWGDAALVRLDRDVLRLNNVRHMILLEGINDIGFSGNDGPTISAGDLIAAYCQIIDRAHARGVKVVGGTMLPFEGAAYYTPDRERIRTQVNFWIRNAGKFDGVIDFEAAVRDPAHPARLRPGFDSKDHLHPNEAGYRAMANAIDLKLLR